MTNKNNAKYAFYYLLSLVALIFVSLSVGMIIFAIIDKTIIDALNNYAGSFDAQLKFAISALIIATPIFYFLTRLINRGLQREELAKESGVRRWLTYFILLISALIVLGSFIGAINAFLSGELTSRFVLKAATVFVLAGTVFGYYFYDIRREDVVRADKLIGIFAWVSLSLVVAAFIASWFFVESPAVARARRLDQALTNNIYSLESVINNYFERYKKLPDNLEVLKNDPAIYLDPNILVDPETKVAIVYEKSGAQNFSLCANFRLDSAVDNNSSAPLDYSLNSKNHHAGYECLTGNLYAVPAQPLKL